MKSLLALSSVSRIFYRNYAKGLIKFSKEKWREWLNCWTFTLRLSKKNLEVRMLGCPLYSCNRDKIGLFLTVQVKIRHKYGKKAGPLVLGRVNRANLCKYQHHHKKKDSNKWRKRNCGMWMRFLRTLIKSLRSEGSSFIFSLNFECFECDLYYSQ